MFFRKAECFKIQLLKSTDGNILDVKQYKKLHQILCDRITVFLEPTMIVADPFLFIHDDILYLFYEHKTFRSHGVIMMSATRDLEEWSQPVKVLEEPFHLSYPWVFEDNGHIYMVPETGEDKSIRLYEADCNDLTSFHLVKKLMEETEADKFTMSFADTSIYKKEDIYYLHTTVGDSGENQLRLYYSKNLLGPYEEHGQSPIITSDKIGRNAGCLFECEGKLVRPAQDCVNGYGNNVHLLQIEKMTTEEYKETLIRENVLDTTEEFYKEGGHQFNVVNFRGTTLLATDAKEYHRFFFNRVWHKLNTSLGCRKP